MAKTYVETLKTEAVKPLYAVAGATELAVQLARGYAQEAQKTASKIDLEPRSLQNQARSALNARVEEVSKEAKDAQARFEARVTELQKEAKAYPTKVQAQVTEALEDLNETYAELAARGEKFVEAVRKDGVKAVTAIKGAPNKSTVVRRERALKPTENQAPAKKTAAKKTPGTKTTVKRTTARKTTGAKPAAKKSTTKSAAKSTPASSTPANSTPANSTPATSTPTTKATTTTTTAPSSN